MQDTTPRLLYPVLETSGRLGIGRTTVYALIKAHKLDARKIGRRTLITSESIDRYVEELIDA